MRRVPKTLSVRVSSFAFEIIDVLMFWFALWIQVDVWCSQTKQRIVGYYQANACVTDSRLVSCFLLLNV